MATAASEQTVTPTPADSSVGGREEDCSEAAPAVTVAGRTPPPQIELVRMATAERPRRERRKSQRQLDAESSEREWRDFQDREKRKRRQ